MGPIPETESLSALKALHDLWGEKIVVMDPMAGGGSIPFESPAWDKNNSQ